MSARRFVTCEKCRWKRALARNGSALRSSPRVATSDHVIRVLQQALYYDSNDGMRLRWRGSASGRYGRDVPSFCIRGRPYSSVRSAERVSIPCQSNGNIYLDIHHALKPSPEQAGPPTVLIYLPRGPYMRNEQDEASTLDILQSHLPWTIAKINYRSSREHQHPTPVHDVLCGYDWILANLLPKRAIARLGRSESVGKLAVCGELVGGGLATMLALTECRIGGPAIVAGAVNNPLMDWVSLTKSASKPGRLKKAKVSQQSALDVELDQLIVLRNQLFARPSGYFDPFASPLLFFRSAGVEVPSVPTSTSQDDMEHLSKLESAYFTLSEGGDIPVPSYPVSPEGAAAQELQAVRRVSRRYPSKALRLRLPSLRVSSGIIEPLRGQSEELIKQFAKSVARQDLGLSDFGRKVLLEDEEDAALEASLHEGSNRVHTRLCDDKGFWDASAAGRERVAEAAKWLRAGIE